MHNPFLANQELLKLQIPDHRGAVGAIASNSQNPNERPESKKGFDITPLGTAQEGNGTRADNKNKMRMRGATDMDDMAEVDEPVPLDHEPFFGESPAHTREEFQNYENFEEQK